MPTEAPSGEPPLPDDRPSRREWSIVLALAVSVVVALAVVARPDQGLMGDEADYVMRALDYRAGTDPTGTRWGGFRAAGMPFLMSLVPGGSPYGMRLVPIMFCGVGIVVTWLLARALFGARAAVIAAALLALTPGWLIWSWWILVDVPGAVLGLAAVTVVVYATAGDRLRWWGFGAVPLALAATYVRYGAPMVVSIAILAVLAYRWPVARRQPVAVGSLAVLTIASMGAVIALPWPTGSDQSPYRSIQSSGSSFVFERFQSVKDFGNQLPEMFGFDRARDLGSTGTGALLADVAFVLGGVFILAIAVGWTVALVRAVRSDHRPAIATVVATIAGSLAVLAVTLNHGETRYLTPVVPWIVIGAAFGIAQLTPRVPRWALVPAWLVLAVPAVLFVAELAPKVEHAYGPYRDMGNRIAADRPECVLVGNVSRPSAAINPRCVMFSLPLRADGTADLDQARTLLADVPRDRQVWVLNLGGHNLFPGEQATPVDLGELQSSFGLREIETGTEPITGLRLFYAT